MSVITKMRKQVCLYWEKTGVDAYAKPKFKEPVELKCRWDDYQKKFITPDGDERTTASVCYPELLPVLGSFMELTTLDDIPDPEITDPLRRKKCHEVQGIDRIPNFKNTEILNVAYLGTRVKV